MNEGENNILECAMCGDTFDRTEVKRVQHSLYGIMTEDLICPHCGRSPVYTKISYDNGRNLLSGAYLSQLKA